MNLLHLTWRRVAVLVVAAALAGGVGFVFTSGQTGDFEATSHIVVSSLVGVDQPDYLASSYSKSISDLVVLDTNVKAALKKADATQGSGDLMATIADGGTTITVTASATTAKGAVALASALGRTAVDDAAIRQTAVAKTSQQSARKRLEAANGALAAFDTANGSIDIPAGADPAERARLESLSIQRDLLQNSVMGAQRSLDDASERVAQAVTFTRLANEPAVIVVDKPTQVSVLASQMTVIGGAIAAVVAVILVVMLLADVRTRVAEDAGDTGQDSASSGDADPPEVKPKGKSGFSPKVVTQSR